MKKRIKQLSVILFCTFSLLCGGQVVQAETTVDEELTNLTSGVCEFYNTPKLDKNGNTTIQWSSFTYSEPDDVYTLRFEVEMSTDDSFVNPQRFTASESSLTFNKSQMGADGGKIYFRVRKHVTSVAGISQYGDWSEAKDYNFVAINKKNFPGIYKVLKNGGRRSTLTGTKKVVYDQNGDGWLDPEEIEKILQLDTADVYKKKNGKYKRTSKAVKISNLTGIEYLSNLHSISLQRYSGKKIDLSKNKVAFLNIRESYAKQITVIAPDATNISVQSAYTAKVKKMDFSGCKNVVDLLAYGNKGTKQLILPKNKTKLKVLSISDFGFKTMNLNAYTNLQQVYFYSCDAKKVTVNKCKKLRYIYFYFCKKIKSLNISANKKLRGADFYSTPGITRKTVKKPKGAKVTWGKGKWWYSTKAYKNDMKKLYQ